MQINHNSSHSISQNNYITPLTISPAGTLVPTTSNRLPIYAGHTFVVLKWNTCCLVFDSRYLNIINRLLAQEPSTSDDMETLNNTHIIWNSSGLCRIIPSIALSRAFNHIRPNSVFLSRNVTRRLNSNTLKDLGAMIFPDHSLTRYNIVGSLDMHLNQSSALIQRLVFLLGLFVPQELQQELATHILERHRSNNTEVSPNNATGTSSQQQTSQQPPTEKPNQQDKENS